jgi:hypothetical protein
MAELAVIIVSYNSANFLGPCLTALNLRLADRLGATTRSGVRAPLLRA